jgi:hypothetical protein
MANIGGRAVKEALCMVVYSEKVVEFQSASAPTPHLRNSAGGVATRVRVRFVSTDTDSGLERVGFHCSRNSMS